VSDICGAAWVFYCSATGKRLQGEFAEQSTWADSYRGEQLGMLARGLRGSSNRSEYIL
jgi:hypothetical protein